MYTTRIGSGDQAIIVPHSAHDAAVVVPSKPIHKGDGSNETFGDNGHSDTEEGQIGASNNLGDGCDNYDMDLINVLYNEDNHIDSEPKCHTANSDFCLQKTWPVGCMYMYMCTIC